MKAKITSEGVFIEQLETDVGKYLPDVTDDHLKKSAGSPEIKAVDININKPMADLRLGYVMFSLYRVHS